MPAFAMSTSMLPDLEMADWMAFCILYMRLYVCMHTFYGYMYMYVYMYACTHTHTCAVSTLILPDLEMADCMAFCTLRVCVYAFICMYVFMCVYIYIYTHTHIYTHIHTYTYMHTYAA